MNIAELLLGGSVCFLVFRHRFGGILTNRKFYKNLTKSKHSVKLDDVVKDFKSGTLKKKPPTKTQGETSA